MARQAKALGYTLVALAAPAAQGKALSPSDPVSRDDKTPMVSPLWGKGVVSPPSGTEPAGSPQNISNDSCSPRRCPTLTAVVPWEAVLGIAMDMR